MRAQRPRDAAPCVAASAEALPFDDDAFDVVMTVLSDHHWSDWATGLRECARVGRRVVLFNWDNAEAGGFWLIDATTRPSSSPTRSAARRWASAPGRTWRRTRR